MKLNNSSSRRSTKFTNLYPDWPRKGERRFKLLKLGVKGNITTELIEGNKEQYGLHDNKLYNLEEMDNS